MADLSDARSAMEQGLESGTANADSAPSTSSSPTPGTEQPSAYDLDSHKGKVKWQGQEVDRAELDKMFYRQADYTKKTQELATERKYYDNLMADLDHVRKNAQLMEEFKKVYPERFHAFLGLTKQEQAEAVQDAKEQNPQQTRAESKPDPLVMDRLTKVEQMIKEREEAEHNRLVESYSQRIDAKFIEAKSKYPIMNEQFAEDLALSRAQAMIDNGTPLDDQMWDKVFESVNNDITGGLNKIQSSQFDKQKAANAVAKDVPVGGGIPASAPPKMTGNPMKDAWRSLEKHLNN